MPSNRFGLYTNVAWLVCFGASDAEMISTVKVVRKSSTELSGLLPIIMAMLAAGIWLSSPARAMGLSFVLPGTTEMPPRESFNAGWRFARFGEQGDGSIVAEPKAEEPAFDDSQWRKLDLPHDWGIEGPFNLDMPAQTGKRPWFGIGWYRKSLFIPAADKGRRIFLDFDGAMSDSTVFLNGERIGGWPYGYSSFRVELTEKEVKFGAENLIAVRLDNKSNASRWYPGGGIYRNTWLSKTDPIHVAHWGVYITTSEVAPDKATVQAQVTVENQGAASASATVEIEVWKLGATPAKVASAPAVKVSVAANGSSACKLAATVANPLLWDLDKPELYCALTIVRVGGKAVDTTRTVFGIRTAVIDPARGLVLNGRKVPIQGVCLHHDLGALGAAFNLRAAERQLERLKEMGCNSIRTSHNPPAPELLDLCDRMGFLVLDEAFDTWTAHKTPNDYARFFAEWHERDVTAFVRRDRNHPSVYLWSAGNEVAEQGQGKGLEVLRELVAIFHREDPTRLVTVGCNNPRAQNGFYRGMDVLGLNYKPSAYAGFHEKEPGVPVFGSETSSAISSRGEYFFPVSTDKQQGASHFQISSYDLSAVRWGTIPDVEFAAQNQNAFVIGEYVWTGFDYLGEPTPWNKDVSNLLNYHDEKSRQEAKAEFERLGKANSPSRSSYFGIIDLAGFPKDRFYLYQARWRPELPRVHILPHWTWPERVGQVTPVQVYTSGDEAELFLNGNSLGKKKKAPLEYRLRWDEVVYEPGELRAVAYKFGKPWAEAAVKTAGPAAKLILVPDHPAIASDGNALTYVTVTVADAEGRMVPRSKNLVKFTLTGPGELVAVDNGDATSLEPFKTSQVKAFNGLCLAIVRAKPGQAGAITLQASGEGLRSATASITSQIDQRKRIH
jgi:beta-galactosidase